MRTSHFFVGVSILLAAAVAQSRADQLVGINFDTGELYQVSSTNAQLTLVGNTGVQGLGSLEWNSNGSLYGATTGYTPVLYKVDPVTAAAQQIGTGLAIDFVFEGSLAFAPNGTAYATNQGSAYSPHLFIMNLATGTATLAGLITGGDHDINGLAWRSDGKLVGLDHATNSLLAIDPATANSSVIAAVPPAVGSIGGMTVMNGVGYFATSGPTSATPGSNELWSFDLLTGQSQLVGSFSPTITGTGIGGLATVPSAVPEPLSAHNALALIAIVGAWKLTRRMSRASRPA